MALVKFNERNDSGLLSPVFSDIFENFFTDSFVSDRMIARIPAVNISETDGHYHIELAAPGLKKEDFKISLDRNIMTISAETKNEQTGDEKKYNKREYSYTSFVRSFTLPDTTNDENIEAEYNDGVLKINVPKREQTQASRRQIEIK